MTDNIHKWRSGIVFAVAASAIIAARLGGGQMRGALFVILLAAFVGGTAQASQRQWNTLSVSVSLAIVAFFVGLIVITRTLAWVFVMLAAWVTWDLWRTLRNRTDSVMYATIGTAAAWVLTFQLLTILGR
jgi:hypothetical protein